MAIGYTSLIDYFNQLFSEYICYILLENNKELLDRARLLNSIEEIQFNETITDIATSFPELKDYVSVLKLKKDGMCLDAHMILNPTFLTFSPNIINSHLDKLYCTYRGTCVNCRFWNTCGYIIKFDNNIKLDIGSVINMHLWCEFARYGILYNIKNANYEYTFMYKVMLDVKPEIYTLDLARYKLSSDFAAKDDIFFSLHLSKISVSTLKMFNALQVKYGVVFEKLKCRPNKFIKDFEDALVKGILNSNTICCFSECKFDVFLSAVQSKKLELLCRQYGIERYYFRDSYYQVIRDFGFNEYKMG